MNSKSIFKLFAMCALIAGLAAFTNTIAAAAETAKGQILSNVEAAMEPYHQVKVEVLDDGQVVLSDAVKTYSERDDTVKRVGEVTGVRSVENKIEVVGPESGSVGKYVDDTAISAAVKAKFLAEEGLASGQISVETVKGVVTLTGEVDNQAQIGLAERVTRSVEGVQDVRSKLTVK